MTDKIISWIVYGVICISIGVNIYAYLVERACQRGWHRKTMHYTYNCTAEPRP
jgi:hypothetical protein